MDIQGINALVPVSSGQSTTPDVPAKATAGASAPAVVSALPDPKVGRPDPQPVSTAAIAQQLQAFLQGSARSVQFSVDADTGAQVITVMDSSSGQVIRQMPSDVALRLMKDLGSGSLIDSKA